MTEAAGMWSRATNAFPRSMTLRAGWPSGNGVSTAMLYALTRSTSLCASGAMRAHSSRSAVSSDGLTNSGSTLQPVSASSARVLSTTARRPGPPGSDRG
jgi:hypothetical protein